MEAKVLQKVNGSCDLLQWAVGLQQRRRRLFVRKAEVATQCAQLARVGRRYVCLNQKLLSGRNQGQSVSVISLAAGLVVQIC